VSRPQDPTGAARAAAGVVYVVAKAPAPGQSKTRLCPPLTPADAARLARAFLLDVLDTVRASGLTARIVCRDAAERVALQALVGATVAVHAQRGSGLGDALESAFRQGLADGFPAVAVLGADVPALRPGVLRDACLAVAGAGGGRRAGYDVALGRSADGGYYLLAARAVHPSLFRDMLWSTDGVAAETLRRCRAAGLRPFLLPAGYDVDDAAALDTLRAELARAPLSLAPRTRAALAGAAATPAGAARA
jgi:rSAM/selenodomain-associated transferase 1